MTHQGLQPKGLRESSRGVERGARYPRRTVSKRSRPEGVPALALAATPSGSNASGVLIRGYRAPRSTPGYYLAALRAALNPVPISDYLMRQVYYCPFKAGIFEEQRHRRVATAETFTQSSLTRRDLFAVTIPALKGRAKFSRRSATKPNPLSIA